jgi:hypothetical protein
LKTTIQKLLLKLINFFNNPIKAFCFSFIIYLIFAIYGNDSIFKPSGLHYFNYLADAFLHDQFHFRLEPPTTHDLVLFDNKIYAYWPPFPAILLMPFVAIFGVNFSDILFTVILGSINVGLFSFFLKELNRKKIISLDSVKQILLVIFFAFGTVYLTMVPQGMVWFTSSVISIFCILLAYIASVKYHGYWAFLLTGIAISAAFTSRMHLFLVGIWPAWYLLSKNWKLPKQKFIKLIFVGLLPLIVSGLFIFYYNYARFGNIFDLGYAYHNMGEIFRADYMKYGGFNLHYVPINLYYQYIAYPFLMKDMSNFFMGGSLFLLSPVFFACFWAFKDKKFSNFVLLTTIFLTNIPILLLMGTGWIQFGPRYTLDYIVPLLILTAIGIKYWNNRILFLLTLISIFQYTVGLLLLMKAVG